MPATAVNFGPDAFDDVTKRHPEFATMAGLFRSRDLPFFSFPRDCGPVKALKAGDVLLRTTLHSKLDKDVKFSFDVALGEPDMPSGAASLHSCRSATKNAITIIGRALGFAGHLM